MSVPINWDELPTLTSGAHWAVENIAERIPVGDSVWNGYAKSACDLKDAMKTLGYKTARYVLYILASNVYLHCLHLAKTFLHF